MRFYGPKKKVLSCKVTEDMYKIVRKYNLNLYDIIVWFLSDKMEEELAQQELIQCEQQLSRLKKEQKKVEKKIKKLKGVDDEANTM